MLLVSMCTMCGCTKVSVYGLESGWIEVITARPQKVYFSCFSSHAVLDCRGAPTQIAEHVAGPIILE